MAVALVGTPSESGVAFDGDASVTRSITAGNGLLILVQWVSTSITLTRVNVASNTSALPILTHQTQSGGRMQLAYLSNITAGGSRQITTANIGGAGDGFSSGTGSCVCQIYVIEVSGQNTTDMLGASDQETKSGVAMTGSIDTTAANSALLAFALSVSTPTLTPIGPSPLQFTAITPNPNDLNNQVDCCYNLDVGATGTKSYGWTDNGSAFLTAVEIKAAAGAAAGAFPIPSRGITNLIAANF